jgi:hypothetical protein
VERDTRASVCVCVSCVCMGVYSEVCKRERSKWLYVSVARSKIKERRKGTFECVCYI